MSVIIVAPDALDGWASDLLGLAADLAVEADECRGAAGAMPATVDGAVGSHAGAAARSWGRLLETLSQNVATCADALYAVAAEYRAVDAASAHGLDAAPGSR